MRQRLLPLIGALSYLLAMVGCIAYSAGDPSPGSVGPANTCELPVDVDLEGSRGDAGPAGDTGPVLPTCDGAAPCKDFLPFRAPILDGKIPANPGAFFDSSGAFTSPLCVVEPALGSENLPGALFPADWARPRFRVKPANREDLFEIRIRVPGREEGELVVYSSHTTWKLPVDLWKHMGVEGHAVDQDITVTIRGVNMASSGPVSGATGTFRIAPVSVGGSIVYEAISSSRASPTATKLVGVDVGSETATDVLTIRAIKQDRIWSENGKSLRGQGRYGYGVLPGHVECIGCHTLTPDTGTRDETAAVGFTDAWPWDNVFVGMQPTSVRGKPASGIQPAWSGKPAWLSAGAQSLMLQPWLGMMTMSKAHFRQGDRIALTSYEERDVGLGYVPSSPDATGASGKDKLAWFDLETDAIIARQEGDFNPSIAAARDKAWGFIPLEGEHAGVISPSFSNDGLNIAYTSATRTQDGRVGDDAETDIHLVPYNQKNGGPVAPLQGAATPGVSEYYPAFSPDDKLIAFNRAPSTHGKIYYRPDGEVWVVESGGGTATRLAANDPPACTGEESPGVINSWPKWSPSVVVDPRNGSTYYWVIFSSGRDYPCAFRVPPSPFSPADTRSSQLYVAGIIIDPQGHIQTFPAIYLWNQDPTTSNLTPTWSDHVEF